MALVRGLAGGADALAGLAAVAAPLLAAASGWAWRVPAPGCPPCWPPASTRSPGGCPTSSSGQAAGVLLIAGACLTLAALIASLAPPGALAAGLVLLAALDVVLVWGLPEVGPATTALHRAVPPELPGAVGGPPLPALQDATFGSALMGWLDLLAPALLATVLAGARPGADRRRRHGAGLRAGLGPAPAR